MAFMLKLTLLLSRTACMPIFVARPHVSPAIQGRMGRGNKLGGYATEVPHSVTIRFRTIGSHGSTAG